MPVPGTRNLINATSMAVFRELEMLACRVLLAGLALALTACSGPRLVNPDRPSADLRTDLAICDREAERVGRREILAGPNEVNDYCLTCRVTAGGREMRAATLAHVAQQRCIAAKGWRAGT